MYMCCISNYVTYSHTQCIYIYAREKNMGTELLYMYMYMYNAVKDF